MLAVAGSLGRKTATHDNIVNGSASERIFKTCKIIAEQ
jgi:hypothetical protein